ncbi:MAG: hypothetical protein R2857_14835 [Vampirovibrionales bacterium]
MYGNGNLTGPMTMYQYQHGQTHPHTSTTINPETPPAANQHGNVQNNNQRQAQINTLQHRCQVLIARMNNHEAIDPALFPGVLPNNFTPTFDPDGNGTIDAYRYERQARRFIRLNITDLNQIVTSPDFGILPFAKQPKRVCLCTQVFQIPFRLTASRYKVAKPLSGRRRHRSTLWPYFSDIQGPNDMPLQNQISRQTDLCAYWGTPGIGNSGLLGHSAQQYFPNNPEATQNWLAQARTNPSSYVYMVSGNLLNLTVEQAFNLTAQQLNQLGAPLPGNTQP